jgi:hypothetical protein
VAVTLPKDEGAVLDLYIDADCGAADPYWAALWPSAVALASALLAQPQLVAGCRVCDVGAGLGLGGLGAALAGAAEVRACVGFGVGLGRVGESGSSSDDSSVIVGVLRFAEFARR